MNTPAQEAGVRLEIRHDWSLPEVQTLFALPFMDLILRAQRVHRACHAPNTVQMSTLLVHQDRRLPGRLRLLSAERALRHRTGS